MIMSILMICCHCSHFQRSIYLSCDQISCKAPYVGPGERLHKFFWLIGLELLLSLPMGNIKLP